MIFIIVRTYFVAITEGTEPCARFGLSIIPVSVAKSSATSLPIDVPCNEVNKFIFTGGSNGTDLIRNGEELYDVRNPSLTKLTVLMKNCPSRFMY